MTVSTPPVFLQDGSHTAEEVRQMMANLFGCDTASFAGGIGAADPGHGVLRPGHLAVSENGTPNMSVNISAGGAFIRGSQAAAQGLYSFYNDGTVNLTIDAADPTNGRKDLIVAQVRDSAYAGSDDDARLFVVKGTAAGSPADPTVPADCLVLARVNVGAGVSSITNANIDELRTFVRPWHISWGVLATGKDTAERTNRSLSANINSAVALTLTMPAGRRLRISGLAVGEQNTSAAAQILAVYKNGSSLEKLTEQYAPAATVASHSGFAFDTPSAGSVTYSLRMGTGAGSVDARGDLVPTTIVVEDVGPA
jgi:hypothetical protein